MTLGRAVLEGIIAHARSVSPAECCGMLVGRRDEILEAVPARNLARTQDRFLIDPRDHVDARRRARARGHEVIGFYHSHPRSAPDPSPTDIEEASYVDHLYLIVSLLPPSPEARLFRFDKGFVEAPFEIADRR